MPTQQIELEKIKTDGGTQARAALNEEVVSEYRDAIIAGANMPEITVFHDGKTYWLADGFHRFYAHKAARALTIAASVIQGTRRDAILHSVGANAHHGLRRTNEDKRCAVKTLLQDKEWGQWSDRQIADACGVSHPFVAAVRRPENAEKQRVNRETSAAKKVESDSTDPSQAAPLSHFQKRDFPEIGENTDQPQRQQVPTTEAHADSSPHGDGESAISVALDTGNENVQENKESSGGTSSDPEHHFVPLAEYQDALENARNLAYELESYMEADKGTVEAAKTILKLKGQIATLASQRDQYMTTCNELKRQVKAQQREIERLKKQVAKP